MSVDEAFRKLMNNDAIAGVGRPTSRVRTTASTGTSPTIATTTIEREPEPVIEEQGPEHPPIDFSRVSRVKRFAHHPVDSRSQIAEEYRILRTRLHALDLKKPSILLTSCHHNEGKTSTALNLSLCFAKKKNARILLVDFDLRRPRLHKMLGLPKRDMDIVNVLSGRCEVEDAMLYSEEDNLYILSAKREYSNGTDHLETRHTRDLIARLHENFDFIIFDSCPCLSTSDPSIIGPHVGGVLMVIRCLQTQRESVEHAINTLNDLGAPVQGIILTFMRYFIPRYLYRYQYYHGYYYYRGYGYGADERRNDNYEDENVENSVPAPHPTLGRIQEDEDGDSSGDMEGIV